MDIKEAKQGLVHSEFHNNHLIEIRDTATQRTLFFDTEHLQSAMSFLTPQELILSYTRFMLLGLLINQRPQNILIIGLGSGSFVRFFHHYYPDCSIDGVDYSQPIIDLAKGYFRLPESDNITVTCADGDLFVQQHNCDKKYDLILVDAFDGQGMAPTIYNTAFYGRVKSLLTDNGSVSFNLWSSDKTLFTNIKKSLAATYHSCLFLPVPDRGNVIAVTMNHDIPWDKIDLPQKELKAFSSHLQLDFSQLVRIAKQNNGTFKTLLKSLFR